MSKHFRFRRATSMAMAALVAGTLAVACSDSTSPRNGTLVVRLTDAPLDDVQSVNVWVVRIDAKAPATDSTDAADVAAGSSGRGWVTVAEPDAIYDLLQLRTDTTTVGVTPLPGGDWSSLRLVIDPAKSYVMLKDGTRLDGRTNLGATGEPGVKFPSASRSGIKIMLDRPLRIDGDTTEVTVDFDAGASFVARGATASEGFIFRPVIRAEVTAQ